MDDERDEAARRPSLASQVAIVVLGAAIVSALGAGLITWSGHNQLVGVVDNISSGHEKELAHLQREIDDIMRELRDVEARWHGCAERMARLEQISRFYIDQRHLEK